MIRANQAELKDIVKELELLRDTCKRTFRIVQSIAEYLEEQRVRAEAKEGQAKASPDADEFFDTCELLPTEATTVEDGGGNKLQYVQGQWLDAQTGAIVYEPSRWRYVG